MHTGGGFSGKGFKFDESEAALANEKKKFQKAALGLQDSDDEDIENDIDQQIESMLAPKRTVREIARPSATSITVPGQPTPSATDKLELARRLASKINIAKNLGAEAKGATQQAAEAILKGAGPTNLITVRSVEFFLRERNSFVIIAILRERKGFLYFYKEFDFSKILFITNDNYFFYTGEDSRRTIGSEVKH